MSFGVERLSLVQVEKRVFDEHTHPSGLKCNYREKLGSPHHGSPHHGSPHHGSPHHGSPRHSTSSSQRPISPHTYAPDSQHRNMYHSPRDRHTEAVGNDTDASGHPRFVGWRIRTHSHERTHSPTGTRSPTRTHISTRASGRAAGANAGTGVQSQSARGYTQEQREKNGNAAPKSLNHKPVPAYVRRRQNEQWFKRSKTTDVEKENGETLDELEDVKLEKPIYSPTNLPEDYITLFSDDFDDDDWVLQGKKYS